MFIKNCHIVLLLLTGLVVILAPSWVYSAPQYDTFIKTNISRSVHRSSMHNDHPDAHRGGHKERHGKGETVQTSTGLLRGIRRTVLGKEIHVFYGVPFAKPPLGELRFKKPVPIEPWNGTFNAFHQPNTCFQEVFESFPGFKGEVTWLPNTNISEDCLYMNIWVPAKPRKHKKMPILVWIYGGGYTSGTATLDIYNADILAAENNVIVVVPQYRVGVFGFLYFGHENAPGNMGLLDQVLAMQWIKDNAARFNGDPNSITVFGESAGGSSVTVHLLAPVSRHLIDRGIIQSGTINAPWSVMTGAKAKEIANRLVTDCNCTNPDGSAMSDHDKIECLRGLPAKLISAQQWNSYTKIINYFSAPTIDGDFLPRDPMEMLKDGDFKKVPLLIGSNRDEGTYFILYDFIENFQKDGPNCQPREVFLETLEYLFANLTQAQKQAIRFQYTHWEDVNDPCKVREKFIDFVGDYYFICPTNKFAETYSGHGAPVYYYFFTQRTSSNPWGDWMGVMHADEIEYVFGQPLNNSNDHTHKEQLLSKRIMKYFTHFAETGSTTPHAFPKSNHQSHLSTSTSTTSTRKITTTTTGKMRTFPFGSSSGSPANVLLTSPATNEWWSPTEDSESDDWPLYTKEQPNYYILNAEEKGLGRGPRSQSCAFWNEFMPLITPVPGECDKERWNISGALMTSAPSNILMLLGITSLIICFSHWRQLNHINMGQFNHYHNQASSLF